MFVKLIFFIFYFNYCLAAVRSSLQSPYIKCELNQNCVPIDNCKPVLNDLNTGKISRSVFKGLQCGKYLFVCCNATNTTSTMNSEEDNTNVLEESTLLPEHCGYQFNKSAMNNTVRSGEYPFLAGLMLEVNKTNYQLHCLGTIISNKYILTTAECIDDEHNEIKYVWVGLYNLRRFNRTLLVDIETIIKHPEYNPLKYYNDIALIRLKSRIYFNKTIQPICLPRNDLHSLEAPIFIGWGINRLINIRYKPMRKSITVIDKSECLAKHMFKLHEGYFCGKFSPTNDSCIADIGGPIMYQHNNQMYAYGLITGDISICYNFIKYQRDDNLPEIYPILSAYIPWIISNLMP